MENASSGVHSAAKESKEKLWKYVKVKFVKLYELHVPFFVGFDIANIAGLVEVEPLRASNTYY